MKLSLTKRGCQSLFSRPPTVDSRKYSVGANAKFSSPSGNAHCFSVEAKTPAKSFVRCAERIPYSPAASHSRQYCTGTYSSRCSPFRQAHSFAVESNPVIRALVASLRQPSCPDAVARFIVSVAVKSFYAVLWCWFWTNIFIERLKGLSPTVAHNNSSSTISSIVWNIRVVATRLHIAPCSILRRFSHSMCKVVWYVMFKASAALRHAVHKITSFYVPFGSTGANAFPVAIRSSSANVFKNSPSSECLPSQVFCSTMEYSTIISSHENTFFVRVVRVAQRLRPAGLLAFYNKTFAIDTTSTVKRGK